MAEPPEPLIDFADLDIRPDDPVAEQELRRRTCVRHEHRVPENTVTLGPAPETAPSNDPPVRLVAGLTLVLCALIMWCVYPDAPDTGYATWPRVNSSHVSAPVPCSQLRIGRVANTTDIGSLFGNLSRVMQHVPDTFCVGAPEIGVFVRAVLLRSNATHEALRMFNPALLPQSGTQRIVTQESQRHLFPHRHERVRKVRDATVTVSFRDERCRHTTVRVTDLATAVCMQQVVELLDGVTVYDALDTAKK